MALTRSMNLDRPTDESSLLLSASRVGRNEIVGSLIDANLDGIDVSAKNYRGEFALLAAAENGHLGVARTLLQHGAKVNMAGPKVRSTIQVKIWKEAMASQVDGEMKKDIVVYRARHHSTPRLQGALSPWSNYCWTTMRVRGRGTVRTEAPH